MHARRKEVIQFKTARTNRDLDKRHTSGITVLLAQLSLTLNFFVCGSTSSCKPREETTINLTLEEEEEEETISPASCQKTTNGDNE